MAESNEEKVVEVKESTLAAILDKLENLEKSDAEKTKKISKLLAVADKSRLYNYESQHEAGAIIREAMLSTWEDQVILGWKKIKDEVGFVDGVLKEKQTIKLFIWNEDKKPKEVEIDYLLFARNVGKISGEIVKQSKGTDGETYTIRLEDGREFEMDIAFLN